MTQINIQDAPVAVQKAFAHVRKFHPEVVRVSYLEEEDYRDESGTQFYNWYWEYADIEGNVIPFGSDVDTNILEDAIDSVYDSSLKLPVTFAL